MSTSVLFWKFCNVIINAILTWHSDLKIIEKNYNIEKTDIDKSHGLHK